MSDTPTPETDAVTRSSEETPWTPWVCAGHAKRFERERDETMESLALVRKQLVAMKELNEARRERDELKRAAIEVLKVVPVAYCSEMYHGKRDMHSALEPCPVVDRYNAKIDKLRALLKEEA